jgi:hypothetical protein
LGPDAVTCVRKRLKSGKDGQLARQVLVDIGVVPSARERDLGGDSETGNPVLDLLKKVADLIAEPWKATAAEVPGR